MLKGIVNRAVESFLTLAAFLYVSLSRLAEIAAYILITIGASMVYTPAGYIVAGASLLIVAAGLENST